MLKTLALVAASATLVVGAVAVAQTTNNSPNNPNAMAPNDGAASADQNGTNTQATTDQNNNTAGERG